MYFIFLLLINGSKFAVMVIAENWYFYGNYSLTKVGYIYVTRDAVEA